MMPESSFKALVHIKQHNIALLFANYLTSIGINVKVEQEQQGFALYCLEEDFSRVKIIFEEFIQNPQQSKYQQAAWQSAEVTKVVASGPAFVDVFKQQFLSHAGMVTLTVFALCWAIFIASLLGWARPIFNAVQFYPTLSLDALIANPFKLIGPALFHFSWLHIVFNTMWWWQLGGSIEKNLGKVILINLFLISAIASNLAQFLVSGAGFGGLSGVVYGVVGFVWWMGWLAPEKGLSLSKAIIGFLLFWLMLGYADVLPVNMANTAHLVGLISGCIMALFVSQTTQSNVKSKS
jgi:GlpG protein